MKTILITGAAGFIGARLVSELINGEEPYNLVCVDNLNSYYDPSLKGYRLDEIRNRIKKTDSKCVFTFYKGDISNANVVDNIFRTYNIDIVVNLAAQAGVRYSIVNPDAYIESNIVGFHNILKACSKSKQVEHLIYASSSSVYGDNPITPYSESSDTDMPVSLYAATKKSNELMAYAYSSMYKLPATGLRFFTVYGEAGRPDMAYYKLADMMVKGHKIPLYNNGDCVRDFTYVGDVVKGIIKIIENGQAAYVSNQTVPHKIYNIGCSSPVRLMDFVKCLHQSLIEVGVLSESHSLDESIEYLPKQCGDVDKTFSDSTEIFYDYDITPEVNIEDGLMAFAKWYKEYNNINS